MNGPTQHQARTMNSRSRRSSSELPCGKPPGHGALKRLGNARGSWVLMFWLAAVAAAIYRHHQARRRALAPSSAGRSGWQARTRGELTGHVGRAGVAAATEVQS